MGLELPKYPEMEEDNFVNFTDSEIVSHVKDALTSVLSGDSNSYNQLVAVMHHSKRLAPDEVALLEAIVIYVENMLKLESGEIGELVGSTMLMAVVDQLIELDLEIGWDAILQDDFSKGIFEMELEDVDEVEESAEQDTGEFRLSRKSLAGNSIAELLDNLLVLTFEHLESCERAGRLAKVFETLLQSFQITVMSAYKSKFTQFVMFYACALDPDYCGMRFATMLADLFVQDSHPQPIRMSAVAYLASYLSRAKFLSASLISSMLKRLVDWCLEYGKTPDGDINPNAHRVFYSGCQVDVLTLEVSYFTENNRCEDMQQL
ncbi:hypothetical protein SCA6_012538 [Theobroma cacao]